MGGWRGGLSAAGILPGFEVALEELGQRAIEHDEGILYGSQDDGAASFQVDQVMVPLLRGGGDWLAAPVAFFSGGDRRQAVPHDDEELEEKQRVLGDRFSSEGRV